MDTKCLLIHQIFQLKVLTYNLTVKDSKKSQKRAKCLTFIGNQRQQVQGQSKNYGTGSVRKSGGRQLAATL